MDDVEGVSLPAPGALVLETHRSFSLHAKWFIKDVIIDASLDNSDDFNPIMINVLVLDPEIPESGNVLTFEKISPWQWIYDGTIELAKEIMFIARWDDTESLGTVHLRKSELEMLGEGDGLPNQVVRKLVTEAAGPQLKIVFELEIVPPDRHMAQFADRDLIYETFSTDLLKTPETVIARVFENSDKSPYSAKMLNGIGDIFLARFDTTKDVHDIDNSVLSYNLAVQLLPPADTDLVDFLRDCAISVLERYHLTGDLADIHEALSSLRKADQLLTKGYVALPTRLNSLKAFLEEHFEYTWDLINIDVIPSQQEPVLIAAEDHAYRSTLPINSEDSFQAGFERAEDLVDISGAISSQQKLIQLTAEGHAHLPALLNNLGNMFLTRFQRTGHLPDISAAISSQQKSIQLTPDGHEDLPIQLNNLVALLQTRFKHTGDLADISEAIMSQQKLVQLTPEGHASAPPWLNNLGNLFQIRFGCTADLSDLSEAILFRKNAVQLIIEGHECLPTWLSNLGTLLQIRFEHAGRGDITHISAAISYHQRSLLLTPDGHDDLADRLNHLANSFYTRYKITLDLDDISEAISRQHRSILLTPKGYEDLPAWLNSLGNWFRIRFKRTGSLEDISEAISSQEKAVQLTPDGHADLPVWLNNLGVSLQTQFERTGDFDVISQAILSQNKSVELTFEGHPELPARLSNLGASLGRRFEQTGDLVDISRAILVQQQAVEITPHGHEGLPSRLSNLGALLQMRFARIGDLNDINEAIAAQQKSVQLTSEGDPDLPIWLNNLGTSFQTRFTQTGDLADISDAILALQKSVQLTPVDHTELADISEAILSQQKSVEFSPVGHSGLAARLSSLGVSYRTRSERTKDLADLSEAISLQQKAVLLTPEGHAVLPGLLSNLGISLRTRFERTGNLADIFEAISSLRKSIQLSPEGHVDLPGHLNNLGASLQTHFERTEDIANISEAISSLQHSIKLTPEGHADLPDRLNNLGNLYIIRFRHTRDRTDVRSAVEHYRLSATSFSGPPSTRLTAAIQWAHWSQDSDKSQLLHAYHTTICLISQVAGLEKTIQKRYTTLVDISELSASAAAAAITVGRHDLALEWLEQGRCLVWSQLNDLRTPLDDLRTYDPALADDIERVSIALENAGSRDEPAEFTAETDMPTKMSIQAETTVHIKLAQEWDRLLIKVRAISQFEDFLRPASCSTLLKNIPKSGTVVVINIHQDRSDVLALRACVEKPLHIALPKFSHEKANNLRRNLTTHLTRSGVRMYECEGNDTRGMKLYRREGTVMNDTLCQLWTCVAKPILDVVGCSASSSKTSRIWWCVTGPLAFLPIHAAGIYAAAKSTPGNCNVLSDFAISSYIPTVRALIERVNSSSREIGQQKMGLLMISQPDTPDLPRIPGTTVEVGAIQELLSKHNIQHLLWLSRDNATVNRVKEHMDAHSCIHFACHAAQDATSPLDSGFYLYDGRLGLSAIIKEQLQGADLAFLSACQTSTGDEKLSEEAVHLAAGMLAAGYRGVVATMWSIKDDYGPKIAEEFYKTLISNCNEGKRLSSEGAAHALHNATMRVREMLDNSESSLLTWVPYVHFGL